MHRCLSKLVALLALAAPAAAQGLEIHTLDVTNGDCALIISPTGKRVLIDAGKPGFGASVVVPYLQSLGIFDLDYILISHYDGDHIGGVPELMAAGYTPLAVYDRGDLDNEMHSTWQAYVNSIGSLRQKITVGMLLDLGGGATLRSWIASGVIWNGPTINVVGKVENAKSAGWKLEYGNFDYGTFGDIGSTLELPLGPLVGDLDVYKASHHGSNTSSVASFIANIKPDVTFVSSGSASSNPKQATIDTISTATAWRWIYLTEDSAAQTRGARPAYAPMVLETDGNTYTIEGATVKRQTFLCDELTGTAAQVGDIALSEFLSDPSAVSDAEGEYVEITNLTDEFLSMKNWTLRDLGTQSVKIASNALLAPRQTLVVAAQGDIVRNGGLQPDVVWPRDKFGLDNAPDEIVVENAQGVRLIELQHPGIMVAGKSWEIVDLYAPPGGGGNFVLGTTVYGLGDFGSPGLRNAVDSTPWVPMLHGSTPPSGPAAGGTWVTLTGFDLALDTLPVVRFGRTSAFAVDVIDENTIRALSPPMVKLPSALSFLIAIGSAQITNGPAGLGLVVPISIETPGGQDLLPGAFTYSALLTPPKNLPN